MEFNKNQSKAIWTPKNDGVDITRDGVNLWVRDGMADCWVNDGRLSYPLTDEEMIAISAIDRNCRLIKGHVFLWKDGQSWEDLWDMNGEITPP